MGKPYIAEINQLEGTYAAAMDMDIRLLKEAVFRMASCPLYAVGSGGSLSAAHFVTILHQVFAKKTAKAMTPLESKGLVFPRQDCSFWFLSARGRNSDIKDAFLNAVLSEPRYLLLTCANTVSPLAQLASLYKYVDVFDFTLPTQRDGFLATNSLAAFLALSARAYHECFAPDITIPANIWHLLHHEGSTGSYLDELRLQFSSLWDREYILVLYGPLTQPAAYDLESKFTEAALGSVLLADYRNFAHGRHNWLAKRSDASAVIALSTDREKDLAKKTIRLLPAAVPVAEVHFPGYDIWASLAASLAVLHIVAIAGKKRGIDPGRPAIPLFGRKIYNLRTNKGVKANNSWAEIAGQRKASAIDHGGSTITAVHLKQACRRFVKRLGQQVFRAAIFDYDGTLSDKDTRFGTVNEEIAKQIKRLLEADIIIGIATGRGRSVRVSLQQALPEALWKRVVIGYYNGADCGFLNDDSIPNRTSSPCDELSALADVLQKRIDKGSFCNLTIRKYQISLEPLPPFQIERLWELANDLVQNNAIPGTQVLTSSHSIDILAPGVSKNSVVQKVRKMLRLDSCLPVLCIGDRGRWPGNDYRFLQAPFSLSVDEVSADVTTCWNLTAPGHRGVQGALDYFKCIYARQGIFHFQLSPPRRSTE